MSGPDIKTVAGAALDFLGAYDEHGSNREAMAGPLADLLRACWRRKDAPQCPTCPRPLEFAGYYPPSPGEVDPGERWECPACQRDSLRASQAAVQDDLARILRALGLSDAARPLSPHEIVEREVLPAIEALRERVRDLAKREAAP